MHKTKKKAFGAEIVSYCLSFKVENASRNLKKRNVFKDQESNIDQPRKPRKIITHYNPLGFNHYQLRLSCVQD